MTRVFRVLATTAVAAALTIAAAAPALAGDSWPKAAPHAAEEKHVDAAVSPLTTGWGANVSPLTNGWNANVAPLTNGWN